MLLTIIVLVSTLVNALPFMPNIVLKHAPSIEKSENLNKTHPKKTTASVYILLIILPAICGIVSNALSSIIFSSARNTKKYTPHKTKFTEAPCHKPVRLHTINILSIWRASPFLFPPSGIYR